MPTVADIAVNVDSTEGLFDLPGCFDRDAPLELEIGCGKGGFLLRRARAHPERNFLGIEWANHFFRFACDRMARWGVDNVRIARTDARHFVIHRAPPDSLDALHVYHPDPWPKTRHHKRRLFTPDFVAAVVRVLRPQARLAVQTDHADYHEIIRALLVARPELRQAPSADAADDAPDERTETNYEVKYLREGRTIYRLVFTRA